MVDSVMTSDERVPVVVYSEMFFSLRLQILIHRLARQNPVPVPTSVSQIPAAQLMNIVHKRRSCKIKCQFDEVKALIVIEIQGRIICSTGRCRRHGIEMHFPTSRCHVPSADHPKSYVFVVEGWG